LIVDSLRGIDSTGVAVIPRSTGDARIAKAVGDPFQLIDTHAFGEAFKGMNRVCIGHNRWGTVGKNTRANAHPFDFDSLVGAHNGTLTSKWEIPGGNKWDVDSQALYSYMDEKGVKKLMDYMKGAWALVWWDKLEETINFLRNKERSLYLAFTEDGKAVFWASEAWMLTGVLGRHDIKHKEPYMLSEDVHLSIRVGINGVMEKPRAIMCPATYVAKTYFPQHQQNQYTPPGTVPPTTPPVTKKAGGVPQAANASSKVVQLGSKSGLAGSKKVVLEVLSKVEKDEHGSAYLTCFTQNYPYANIRWYYGKNIDADEAIGQEIIGDISDSRIEIGSQATYYKVVHSSVDFVEPVEETIIAEPFPQTYEDFRGRALSYNDWINKHGECAWCSDVVLPTDKHAFNSGGQVFCSHCVDNKEVNQFFTQIISSKVH